MAVRDMVKSALFAALIAICAWIAIPVGSMVFTLQTLGVFLCLLVLGGKWGTICVCLYLLMGFVGLPVFSGFQGGFGVLYSPNGGYLLGFLLCALVYWLVSELTGSRFVAVCAGWLACYAGAGLWFLFLNILYPNISVLMRLYVLPYIIPDMIKLAAALFLAKRLRRFS